MFNKNMLVVSASVAVAGVGFGIYKVVKNINEQKKKENAFFNILKECIENETDYCIDTGIIDKSIREEVIKQIFEDTKKFVNRAEDRDSIFNMSPEEQKRQLTESIKNSHSVYAMYGFCA